ncbi:MAG TPA: aldolase/citrate lyase family protein [Rhizomicrobium sp.]|nr:aldolase/citrate lyase family protein [Rhizomicrobium sp.]
MTFKVFSAAFSAALLMGACAAYAQDDAATGGLNTFPLAPKAGVDSHADKIAPPGAVNQGPFNPKTWKFGHRTDAPPNNPIWNPVKLKMRQGGKITSVTINGNDSPEHYCAAANSGVDFIWTEMQHSGGTWDGVQKMWTTCPYAKAVPGARIPNANEFDEQHAMDLGALWLEIPTVRSLAEAQQAVKWAYYPPMGGRSAGSMTGINFRDVPGGYRNTINDNLVLTVMIETLSGLADADKIAALPGIDAVFAASSDLGNHSGYKAGDPDYEREINIVHDAALRAHKYLCGPYNWLDRPDFNCFQGPGGHINAPPGSDLYAIYADAAKKALGPLWNTQGKVTAGPWSANYKPSAPAARGGRAAPTGGGG